MAFVEDLISLFLGQILILSFSLLENFVVSLSFLFSSRSHEKYFDYKKLQAKAGAPAFEMDFLANFWKPSKTNKGESLIVCDSFASASISTILKAFYGCDSSK